jgi:MspA protein
MPLRRHGSRSYYIQSLEVNVSGVVIADEARNQVRPRSYPRSRARARFLTFLTMCAAVIPLTSAPTAHAGLDNELSIVDEQGRTLNIQQWDTFLQAVHSLDGNRLSREWFYSGQADYHVTGFGADGFKGQISLGYKVGFPWSMGVGVNFSYTTPNLLIDGTNFEPGTGFSPLAYVISPNLLPGASIAAELGNGPGVVEVTTFAADVSGAEGDVLVSDAHGTVTGAAGGVLLCPFARLISADGASVTTYGEAWNMS